MSHATSQPTAGVVRRLVVPVAAVAAVSAASMTFLARIRSYALVGWDTLPEIATSRIEGPASLVAAFTEPTAAGYFPYGSMYRPLFDLSLGLDHALWGLEPFGYLLTGVLLYAATALATFVLARRLFGPAAVLGPLAALATFLLFPAHVEVVPIVSRRADMLCALALVLGVSAQVRRADHPMPRGALVPALFTVLAVAAKEPGLVLVVVAPASVLLLTAARGRARLARAGAAALVHGLAAGLVLLGRVAAIGGMGGHPMAHPAGALTRLPAMLGREVMALGFLQHGPASPAVGWGVTAAVGIALAALAWRVLRADRQARDPDERVPASMALVLAWLVASAAVFGVAGLFQTWYLFVAAPAFALLVGAIAEGSARVAHRSRGVARAGALAAILLVAVWVAWQARWSPLVHRYGHWTRASAITTAYFEALRARIAGAPPGAVVRAAAPPVAIDADPVQPVVRQATVLRGYSVQAWADLTFGDGRVVVRDARGGAGGAGDDGRIVVLLGPGTAVR